MLQIGEINMHIILVWWLAFMETLFSHLNFKPDDEFLPYNMPEVSICTGHGLERLSLTELNLYTGTWQLWSTLPFSNYKSTHTVKALVGIFPNGGELILIKIYLWPISISNITAKPDLINWV